MTFERDGRVYGGHVCTPKKAEVQQRIIGGWITLSKKDHKKEECGTLLF